MENENELEPCPFCEGDARIDNTLIAACLGEPARRIYWAVCESCDATAGEVSDSFQDAIKAWNTRPAIKALRDRLKELENSIISQGKVLYELTTALCEKDKTIKQIEKTLDLSNDINGRLLDEIERIGGRIPEDVAHDICLNQDQIKATKSSFKQAEINERVLERVRSGDDWFPIESAPRDGTAVLLRYYKGANPDPLRTIAYKDFFIVQGYYEEFEYNGAKNWNSYTGQLIQKINGKGKNIVTHWKPLCGKTHIKMLMEREMKG